MDAKETKAALKSAREAIRKKDYKEALKHCKNLLKSDKNNYNALVFIGVAAEGLEQPAQAYAAYKKAVEAEPEQVLAWQGLSGFLEKSEETVHKQELTEVYQKLVTLHKGDDQKKLDTQVKLAQLLRSRGASEKAVEVYKDLLQWCDNTENTLQVWQMLAECIELLSSPCEEYTSLLLEAYKTILQRKTDSGEANADVWLKYIKKLSSGSETELVWTECSQFVKMYPDSQSLFPAELMCQIYLDKVVARGETEPRPDELCDVVSRLEKEDSDNASLKFLLAHRKLNSGDLLGANRLLTTGLQQVPTSASGLLLQSASQNLMHKKYEAKSSAEQALSLLRRKDVTFWGDRAAVKSKLKLLIAKSCVKIGNNAHLQKAQDICKELSESTESSEVWLCLAWAYLAAGDVARCDEMLQQRKCPETAESADLEGWCLFLQGDLKAAAVKFEKSLELKVDYPLAVYHQSRVLWERREESGAIREQCFHLLLKAAKLDPFYSPSFLYLGHYYLQIVQDAGKGRRCYQKAYELDSDSEEAGSALVDCLMATGEETFGLEILESVTKKAAAGCSKWAWLRLGLLQMKIGDPSTAILSLQSALRADPLDVHCWECLGEAYMNRGSYTAALKAFSKATELDTSAMYCYYQLASIKQTLGLFAEAVTEYQGLLEKSPDYIPALKGLGETQVSLARSALTQFFHGRAADHCQSAIWCLTKAASVRPDLSCLWKLLGDACTILNTLPQELVSVEIPNKLLAQSTDGKTKETSTVDKKGLMALGGRCFGMALKLQPDCAALWHDLGVNYFRQSELSDKAMAKVIAAKSVQALQKAATLAPDNYKHWSALGTVAASRFVDHPRLAQHCFIKSVQAEPNNVVAWTNLGTLYLKNDQVELAHEAFKVAQSLDPSYVSSWIGQALVAETVGHEDTMDLFRHATELANHAEAGIGYAHWVCTTLQDSAKSGTSMFQYAIKQMAAIPAASDALAKYTDRVRTNPAAYNMYGLLLEKQGLHKPAAEAFFKAVALLETSGSKEDLERSTLNYARALNNSGQHDGALAKYQKSNLKTSEKECGLALALYKAGHYQDSLKAYERALELCTDNSDKAHTQAAMGMVAYKSGDLELAKTALFKCSQTSDSQPGLQALLSLGLLQNNATLATAVLQELQKMGDGLESSGTAAAAAAADLAVLTAGLHAVQGDVLTGRNHLARCLHARPDNAALWGQMSEYLLRHYPWRGSAAGAWCAGAASQGTGDHAEDLPLLSGLGSLGAGWHAKRDSSQNALSASQRAVHLSPDSLSNWCTLLAAKHAQHVLDTARGGSSGSHQSPTLSLCAHLMARVEEQLTHGAESEKPRLRSLHLWCVKQYILALLLAGRKDQAAQFLQQAAWLYEDDVILKSLLAAFSQNFAELKRNALTDQTPFSWQLLVSLYVFHGLVKELEACYRQWLQHSKTNSEKLQPLVRLTYLAFQQSLKGEQSEKWLTLLKEASTEALRIDSACTVVHFILGLQSLRDKKVSLAKRSLFNVLNSGDGGHTSYSVTTARQHLLQICIAKKDEEGFKTLEAIALQDGDEDFLNQCREAMKNNL